MVFTLLVILGGHGVLRQCSPVLECRLECRCMEGVHLVNGVVLRSLLECIM